MMDSFYLAWRYLRYHKVRTSLLVAIITLTLFVPSGINALIAETARELRDRARQTPLIVGANGSPTELALNSLYFDTNPPEVTKMAIYRRVRGTKYASAIPLHARFRAQNRPIVGTSLDYFSFRELEIESGRFFAMLGECVVGAEVAKKLGLKVGSSVISQPESIFDLAGVYPLKMNVVGVLKATGSPDDDVIFVDVKTTWIIAGLGHGHQNLSKDDVGGAVLTSEENRLTANASVLTYTEITPENVSSFHFHGNRNDFPLTGIIAVPVDAKGKAILLGRFQSDDRPAQMIDPSEVMEQLLSTVLRVRNFVLAGSVLLAFASLCLVFYIFGLSVRLRKREIETMRRIGAGKFKIVSIIGIEIALTLVTSSLAAAVLTALSRQYGSDAIRWFLL
ncbi:MAG: ABC transporter permease [Planctomycetota bacterium]